MPSLTLLGCASTGGGATAPDPTAEVRAALDGYHAALTAEDVDQLVGTFSDDFTSPDGGEKAVMGDFFRTLIGMGALAGIQADMSAARIEVDGDEATIGPVWYDVAGNRTGNNYRMRKEADGVWRFVYSETL